jgi:hypothetical protein
MRRDLLLAAAVGVLLAAGTAGPALAVDPDPQSGPPVTDAMVAQLALTALACQDGGPSAADGAVAAAVTGQIDGSPSRMGGSINAYQVSCARAIVDKTRTKGLPERAAVIAVTTAMTETTLHNWDGGDRDSVGLFQQRASWGSVAEREDPSHATNSFLVTMLRFDNWKTAPIGEVCQEVQVSALPDAYGHEVHNATVVVDALWTPPPPAQPDPRIGIVRSGAAYVKEGPLGAQWKPEYTGVAQVVVAGDRIGVLTTGGDALVKEGVLAATWKTEHAGVKQLVLDGDRIGVLLTDGTALVKDGGLSAVWTPEHAGVAQLAVSGDRIGVLLTDGTAMIKDGPLGATWTTEHAGVTQLALSGDRIGVLLDDGSALVKEGGLSALWKPEHAGVERLALSGDRIGVLLDDGSALVKEGDLAAVWKPEHAGVTQLVLARDRIGVLLTDGTALVKEGGLGELWTPEQTGVSALALS